MPNSNNVQITLYGELKRYLKSGATDIEVADGLTIIALLGQLGVDPRHPRITAVNDETVDEDYILKAGDHLEVFHAIAGG